MKLYCCFLKRHGIQFDKTNTPFPFWKSTLVGGTLQQYHLKKNNPVLSVLNFQGLIGHVSFASQKKSMASVRGRKRGEVLTFDQSTHLACFTSHKVKERK